MLEINDKAPDFQLSNQDDETVSLGDFAGEWLVLYFYPKDDTPGCTKEACDFTDGLPNFSALNANVIGVSVDDTASHRKFIAKYNLPFRLVSDVDKKVLEAYGAWGEKKMYGKTYMGVVRSAFLIDEEGKIAATGYKISPKNTVPTLMKWLADG